MCIPGQTLVNLEIIKLNITHEKNDSSTKFAPNIKLGKTKDWHKQIWIYISKSGFIVLFCHPF